jgi:hypothetical protein
MYVDNPSTGFVLKLAVTLCCDVFFAVFFAHVHRQATGLAVGARDLSQAAMDCTGGACAASKRKYRFIGSANDCAH